MAEKSCRNVTVVEVAAVGQRQKSGSAVGSFHELVLENPGWEAWKPGQFVMVRPPDWGLELVWGRPFSIAWADERELRIFFQVVGRGTARLARLQPGDTVTVWGPLGNGFAVEPDTPTLLLGGGVGLAPFQGYVRRHPRPDNLELLFAHRLPLDCYPYASFQGAVRCGAVYEQCPEDLDTVIARMREKIADHAPDGLVLACGPLPFMRTVQRAAQDFGVRAQLSLEYRMACGVGACLGCVCEKTDGKRVQTCTGGPVFWAKDIVL